MRVKLERSPSEALYIPHKYTTVTALHARCRWLADRQNFLPDLCLYLSHSFTFLFLFGTSHRVPSLQSFPWGDSTTAAIKVCFQIEPPSVIGSGGHCSLFLTGIIYIYIYFFSVIVGRIPKHFSFSPNLIFECLCWAV